MITSSSLKRLTKENNWKRREEKEIDPDEARKMLQKAIEEFKRPK
jgi:hypothetical protein